MRATAVPVGAEIIFGMRPPIAQCCQRLHVVVTTLDTVSWASTGDQYLARFRLEDTSSQES